MRHQRKGFKLGRTASHRRATMSAMSAALIKHKRISTTHAKAKALRMYVEPLISRAREDTMHNRRQVFRRLQDKSAVTELFADIATRVGNRPGGYTRIVKLGQRGGDAAPMAVIELVDYNDIKPEGGASRRRKTRRSRSRRGSRKAAATAAATQQAEASAEEAEGLAEEAEAPAADVEDPADEVKASAEAAAVGEDTSEAKDGAEPDAQADDDPKKDA